MSTQRQYDFGEDVRADYGASETAGNGVAPIGPVGETGLVLALHPSMPVKSITELIADDKATPGKINYGSGGTSGITHRRRCRTYPDFCV